MTVVLVVELAPVIETAWPVHVVTLAAKPIVSTVLVRIIAPVLTEASVIDPEPLASIVKFSLAHEERTLNAKPPAAAAP